MSHVAPMRSLNRPKPTVSVERRADGVLVLSAGRELPDGLPLMIDWLQRAAERRPQVTFLAERRGPDRGWQRLSYAEAWAKTGAVASWLIAQGFGPELAAGGDPVGQQPRERAVPVRRDAGGPAGGADLAQLLAVGGFHPARPCARRSSQPALVFAQDSVAYGKALDRATARIVTVDGKRGLPFGALTSASIDAAVAERRMHITADTPAKILFTSGSTGMAKGVLNTHGNLASAAEMIRMVGEPLDDQRIALSLDWLPWHHTWGGNANLNSIIRVAGSMYIDGGRPLPGRFQETLENLRELSPSSFGIGAGGLSDAARGARARHRPARQVLQEHARAGLWRRAAAAGELRPAAGRGDGAARRAPAVRLRLGHDRDHQHRPDGLLERRSRRAFWACRSPACWPSWCRRATATSCA